MGHPHSVYRYALSPTLAQYCLPAGNILVLLLHSNLMQNLALLTIVIRFDDKSVSGHHHGDTNAFEGGVVECAFIDVEFGHVVVDAVVVSGFTLAAAAVTAETAAETTATSCQEKRRHHQRLQLQ